jgi:Fic family protein
MADVPVSKEQLEQIQKDLDLFRNEATGWKKLYESYAKDNKRWREYTDKYLKAEKQMKKEIAYLTGFIQGQNGVIKKQQEEIWQTGKIIEDQKKVIRAQREENEKLSQSPRIPTKVLCKWSNCPYFIVGKYYSISNIQINRIPSVVSYFVSSENGYVVNLGPHPSGSSYGEFELQY